jgi:hypothetical protein
VDKNLQNLHEYSPLFTPKQGDNTMNKSKSTIALIMALAISMASAADIPRYCTEEIITISKGNGFDMQKFMSDLPPAVAKAKLQAKAPFGKPKDSDKTDIGMTFGCLKVFPESPNEIQSLLKDVGQEAAQDAVGNQLYANVQETQQQTQPQYNYPPPQYNYPPPQYQYPPQQMQQVQCQLPDNFTAGERWGTWALNTIIPGLGSAVIMEDYAGMGIHMGLTALGIVFIAALGYEENNDYGGSYCVSWDSYGNCNYYSHNYYKDGPTETVFLPIGIGLLAVEFIFNIARSNSYNKPTNNYASNEHSRFNVAVLPNRHGKIMSYLMYNKAF